MAGHSIDSGSVDPRLVANRAAGWHSFTRFATAGVVSVVIVLSLMAIFLL